MTPSNSGRYDETGDSATMAVVDAVATHRGVDPVALPPLYEWIDPDALDSLFAPTRTGGERRGRLEFAYDGHEIVVEYDDGVEITVDGTRTATPVSAVGSDSSTGPETGVPDDSWTGV